MADPGGELRSRLDGQGVRADVVDARADRSVERRLPVVGGLTGGAVDQVEADVVEPGGTGLGHGVERRLRRVGPVEEVEDPGRCTLCMPNDTRVTRGARRAASWPGPEPVGIRLDGDLDVAG